MYSDKEVIVSSPDQQGESILTDTTVPELYRGLRSGIYSFFYKVEQTRGQLTVWELDQQSPLAIIESTANPSSSQTDILYPPSVDFFEKIRMSPGPVVSNSSEQVTVGRVFRNLNTAMEQLKDPDEEQILSQIGFKLQPLQYRQLASAMQRIIIAEFP